MKKAVWGVCLVLFGVALLIVTLIMWLKERSFAKKGVACVAWVKDARMIYVSLSGGGRMRSYGLLVSYTVDGIEYSRELPVGREEYEKGGDREIAIRYKESNPKKIASGEPGDSKRAVGVFLAAGVASLALGFVLIAAAVL